MKTRFRFVCALAAFLATAGGALAQGTAFTYQGRLHDGGALATGNYDFRFRVFDAVTNGNSSGGMVMLPSVSVTNGLFTVTLAFGPSAFNGNARWLEIGVRPTGGSGSYTNVEPRQPITATPYAITAGNVTGPIADGQLSASIARLDGDATFTGAVVFSNTASQFAGTFAGNGAGVTNLNLPLSSSGAILSNSALFSLVSMSAASYPGNLVTADANGDGWPDLITPVVVSTYVEVLTNDSRGRFSPAYQVGGVGHPACVAVGDVNGDGRMDLISGDGGPNRLTISTNNVGGGFTYVTDVVLPRSPLAIVAADVNADGRVDLVAADGNDSLHVVFNDHPNGFILASSPTVGLSPYAVAAADVNGDNRVDLISANFGANTLTVLTNTGFGFFALATTLTVGLTPQSVVAADVNGDGAADLISANNGSASLSVLTNDGSGEFALASSPTVGIGAYSVAASDVDGDGTVDLISANYDAQTLSVLINDGAGAFPVATTLRVAAGQGPISAVTADMNGDGRTDLASVNYGTPTAGSSVAVFLNTPFEFLGNFTGSGAGLTSLNASNLYGTIPDGRLSANVALLNDNQTFTGQNTFTGPLGITLNAADRPLITRGWDAFTSGPYVGAGRWGLFMEPNRLNIGMPSLAGKSVQIVKYNADGNYGVLMTVDQSGNLFTAGGVNPPSDRHVKRDFEHVDPRAVLAKVAALPIQKWTYTNDTSGTRHIGPVAQDFKAAFGLGADDKHIATVDADGVALAAIQGLNQKLDEQLQARDAEIERLKRSIEELKKLVLKSVAQTKE